MPIQGLTRLRYVQIGKQSALATSVPATRRVPWRGIITLDPQRTDPDVDTGTIDPAIIPYNMAHNVELPATGPLIYNDLPFRLAAALVGGVVASGGGSAKTHDYQLASLTSDPFDYFTIETGDDTAASDGIEGYGGVIDSWEETMPEDLGPWTFSDNWVFADATLATDKTGALTVDTSPTFVMGAHTTVYKDSTPGSIGVSPLTDAVHGVTLRGNNNLDRKRFANGSNGLFALSGYGRGPREIELELTVAKTAATMAERATLDDDPVPVRYFMVDTSSTALITGATYYSYKRRGAFTLRSARDGEIGGNATIILTYRAIYDTTLGYAYRATVVNTLASLN